MSSEVLKHDKQRILEFSFQVRG